MPTAMASGSKPCLQQLFTSAALCALLLASGAAACAERVCDVKTFGAKGDGTSKDTHAIQNAIDACAEKNGGTVRLASGTFLSGPIVLKSNITLEVDAGATLLGSQDKADYPEVEELRERALQPLVSAELFDQIGRAHV